MCAHSVRPSIHGSHDRIGTYHRFRWLVEGRLAGAPRPDIGHAGGLPAVRAFLEAEGVGAIVTLEEQPLDPDPTELGFAYGFFATENFHPPPDLDAVVRFVDAQLDADRGVLVHCFAGIGRTGTALAAWLIRNEALSAAAAIARVRDDYIPDYAKARFPEHPRQQAALEAFAATIKSS